MKDKIFLITQDNALQELEAAAYATEDLLQRLLSDYPDLLAGYQMNESDPRRWLLIAREVGIADDPDAGERWSLDHLFLDQDGTLTLVEVKRASDTRIRREVVGQMLDYAANAILHWLPQVVWQKFEATCRERNVDPIEEVAEFLDVDPGDEDAITLFWEDVFNKLKIGQVRLVFVADRIPKELRRIIEFLNEHMQEVEVLGVELPQYVGKGGLRTIVPRLVGQTSAAEQTKRSSSGQQWDEESFFSQLEQHSPSDVPVARGLLEWANAREDILVRYGSGGHGSMTARLDALEPISFFAVINYGGGPKVKLQLKDLDRMAPFDNEEQRLRVIQRLNEIDGINFPSSYIEGKRPSVDLGIFGHSDSLRKLTDIYDWIADEIMDAGQPGSRV